MDKNTNNIIGVEIIKKDVIADDRGKILHMLKSNDKNFKKFGEIYFSEIKKGQIKGWNLHKRYMCHLAVISGSVTFNFIDSRKNSKTFLRKEKITLSKKNYAVLLVPPKIWFNFTTRNKVSLVANTLNYPHLDSETKKINKL